MFSKTAQYYDEIYSFKDYRAEADQLLTLIGVHLGSAGNRLLDVACGTGQHIKYLKAHFEVAGLDLDQELLEIARQRNPDVALHYADMTAFDLGCKFDVVTCLFGSIGYVKTIENLARAVTCMAGHLVPGGLLLVEPWLTPEDWMPHTVHARFIDKPELKIARIHSSLVAENGLSALTFHYLIGTPAGTEHLVEQHVLGLFTREEMQIALSGAGLEVLYDAEGLMGRGLYLGKRRK